ncbi:unnamed protein product [Phytophthora lilii]|uniref:Unnamed protein product n=1 Tax=Phytophthora lilii TaxID=2077276 RepID=A0A9W6WSA0_9STRA|nr:unnamed protein product [Phytophthora lilii]
MIRTRRSLKAMATCSDVTTCLSEGSTECTLASETCPPCVYALTGGDYSCYSRDTSGDCPFSGTYAECDKSSSTSTSKTSRTSSGSSDSTPAAKKKTPTKTPTAATEAPATEAPATEAPATEAPATEAPATQKTSAPETSSSTNSKGVTDEGTSSTRATTSPSATTSSTNSDVTQSSTLTSNSDSNSGAEKALTSNTTATTGSPAVVNLALVGGAVVLVVIVIAFVARRVVRKKKMAHTQEQTISSNNSAWSDRTLGTGASGGNLYSTYSYKDEASKGTGMSMMSESQASSTYGPGYNGQPGSSPRSTADFSNFGGNAQFAENSQYYSDYSVSTGPELLAAAAVAGAQHHYANNGVPPSTRAGNNFVDATSMNRVSDLDSMRSGQQPLTVSQLMPTAIEEDEEEAYASRRPAARAYNLHTTPSPAIPPTSLKPQIFAASGVSDASSMRSDYDIVDPITMRDVEARNTEMLAEDGRYPKFSFESEADIYDGSSSEEESSDDERLRQGEHTI